MKRLTQRLFQEFKRVDGLLVLGFIATAEMGNSQTQKTPFRLFVTRNPTLVNIGDVIITQYDEKIILLEHPANNEFEQNFKAAFTRTAFDWVRPIVLKDPVTGFERDTVDAPMGKVYANFDTPLEDRTLTLSETEYRFLTGSAVQPRDKVGGKIVKRVEQVLGVNLVYAS